MLFQTTANCTANQVSWRSMNKCKERAKKDVKDRGLNKIDKLFAGRGARPCAPTENAGVIKFVFLSFELKALLNG
ncbi:hypothetical protein C7B82_03915 [Stenomitos frigidus ULC18]|uniref:Uncharacterized protein n=1 Tax=Stenomitos frigidus ULC18 TaxID=2107698 RepID=A0A2T1ELT5_9CYAN|nr:hypothetical protein C7B82_03915 [Stenomitos frigidus ULC18]